MRTTFRQARSFFLDLDWWVESPGGSAMGRGLEVTGRGAKLPVSCRMAFADDVVLHLSLPARERLFRARCVAVAEADGCSLRFTEVAPDDLQLLGHTLISEFGALALPEPRQAREATT